MISENDVMTVFNVTSSYAQTKELVISTEDEYGPVEGAEVSFAVLNYSDFFPAAVVKTDKNGKAVSPADEVLLTCALFSEINLPKRLFLPQLKAPC